MSALPNGHNVNHDSHSRSSSDSTSTPPSFMTTTTSSRAVPRPPPPRQGAPASTRNFQLSSAGGAPGTLVTRRGKLGASASNTTGQDTVDEAQANKMAAWGSTYNAREETLRNDYSSHYVQTGQRPQNHIRGAQVSTRFQEYPKLASLLALKHTLTDSTAHSIPPTYLETGSEPLADFIPKLAHHRFDVIVISPPATTPFDELLALEPSRLAATPGFVWLWVGSGARGDGIGLEKGRELLAAWGYRRSEDIVWLKTNKSHPERDLDGQPSALLTPTVEHCLMGIRGTVRRSNDPWFVHCNVDTDVIVWEGDEQDPGLKPPELHSLVENFCLGTRRLHLYGSPRSLRRGWLTVGPDFTSNGLQTPFIAAIEGEHTTWQAEQYGTDHFSSHWTRAPTQLGVTGHQVSQLLPFVEELDALRPKSPPLRNGQPSSGGLGRGRGAGLGVTRSGAANALSLAHPKAPQGHQGAGMGPRGHGLMPQPGPPPPPPPPHHVLAAQQHQLAIMQQYQHQRVVLEHQARQMPFLERQTLPPPPPPPPLFDQRGLAHQFAGMTLQPRYLQQNAYHYVHPQHPHLQAYHPHPHPHQQQLYQHQYSHPHPQPLPHSFAQFPQNQQSNSHPFPQHEYAQYPIGGPRPGTGLEAAQVDDAPPSEYYHR